ncbi:MAG: hypothetical protein HZC22_13205 [Rhodocyclales bacterium]|nr:hypothetical protein [Rhodocyclales bacterium]
MDDFIWHARGQLCEQHATSKHGGRITYRIGVFESKEYARRAAAAVNACAGCATDFLETVPRGFFNFTYGQPAKELLDDLRELMQEIGHVDEAYLARLGAALRTPSLEESKQLHCGECAKGDCGWPHAICEFEPQACPKT